MLLPTYQVILKTASGVASSARRFGPYRAEYRAVQIVGRLYQESAKTADHPKGKVQHSHDRERGSATLHDHSMTIARGSLWCLKYSYDRPLATRASHQVKGEDPPGRSSMGKWRYDLRACRNRGSASSQILRLRRSQDQFANSPMSPTQFYPMKLFKSLQSTAFPRVRFRQNRSPRISILITASSIRPERGVRKIKES